MMTTLLGVSTVVLLAAVMGLDAADEGNGGTTQGAANTPAPVSGIESEFLGIRIWMLGGIIIFTLLCIIVVLCCVFDCRIPRTQQEMDADLEKARLTEACSRQLGALVPGQRIHIGKGKAKYVESPLMTSHERNAARNNGVPSGDHVDGVTCRITPAMRSEHTSASTIHNNDAFVSSGQDRDCVLRGDDSPWLRQKYDDRSTFRCEPVDVIEISPVMTNTSI